MKLLLIGANSFVGKRLANFLSDKYEIIGTYHKKKNGNLACQEKLDITDKAAVIGLFRRINPDVVIIASAISSTSAPAKIIRKVNVDGVRNIVDAIHELDINPKIVFFSSNQIFDGKKGLYKEENKPCPVNDYGRSKVEGEAIVRSHQNHIILRLSVVQGPKQGDDHDCFVTMFLNSKERLTIFSDVARSPTFIGDIPLVVEILIQKDWKGTLNLSGPELVTYADLAKAIEKVFGVSKEYAVVPCPNPDIPKKLGLDITKLKEVTGYQMTRAEDMLIKIRDEMGAEQ